MGGTAQHDSTARGRPAAPGSAPGPPRPKGGEETETGSGAAVGSQAPLTPGHVAALQRVAGNAAVAHLLAQAPAAAQRQTGGAGGDADAGVVRPPVPEQRPRAVEKVAVVAWDGKPPLRLRVAPDTGSEVLDTLEPNTGLFVHSELRAPPGWSFVTLRANGRAGYVASAHLAHPPGEDPGARLHRIAAGDTVYRLTSQRYGPVQRTGWDLRYYANVLVHVNRQANRPYVTGPHKRKLHPALTVRRTDYDLIAGKAIWLPSKDYADALHGSVPSGSKKHAIKRAAKTVWNTLVAVPPLVAGIAAGSLETLWDIATGMLKMIKAIIDQGLSAIYDQAVDFAVWLIELATDSDKRKQVLHALGSHLQRRWDAGWYARGKIFGALFTEVIVGILTWGTSFLRSAAGWVKKLWKIVAPTRFGKRVERAARATATTRAGKAASTALQQIAARKRERQAKRRAREATKRGLKPLPKSLDLIAQKLGYPPAQLKAFQKYAVDNGLRIWLRPSNPASAARIAEGAIPKPYFVKANTINTWDLHLGQGFGATDLGKVGYFKPVVPKRRPAGVSTADWKSIKRRARHRRKEFRQYAKEMRELQLPRDKRKTKRREKTPDAEVRVNNGIVEVKHGGDADFRTVGGDVDAFQFARKSSALLSEAEHLEHMGRMTRLGMIEHGPLLAWKARSRRDRKAYEKLVKHHRRHEPLAEIGPDGSISSVYGTHVPGASSTGTPWGLAAVAAALSEQVEPVGEQ